MSKQDKKLLNEAQTLRWMKLANISNLSEKFIKENYEEEEGAKKEEETLQRTSEVHKLSQTPVKQGGNKTMAQESVQQEENLQEVMPEESPEEAPVGGPPEAGPAEPDGDEGGAGGVGEPMIADLVKAIADAITAQTGVAVDVEGAGPPAGEPEGGEGMPPPPAEKPEDEQGGMPPMGERNGHRDHTGTTYDHEGKPIGEGKAKLKEDFSEAPKVTKQNSSAQGSVKDPYKSQVKVQGVEKPESMGTNSYPHKMKALEEQLMKRVYARIMEDLKKVKEGKKPATPAKKK